MQYRICDRRYFWIHLRRVFQCSDRNIRRQYSGATQHDNELEDSTVSASNFSPLKSRLVKVRIRNSAFKTGF